MSAPVLEMRGICKSFPGVCALDNVSFEVYAGEILAIVGQNGAGKSTLMKILSGAYGHDTYEGTIYIDGKKQLFQSPSDAAREGIAMIYQEINMHLDLGVAENLFMGRWKKGKAGRIDWEQLYTQSEEYLKLVGLQVSSRQPVRYLSSSQQQLLSIAGALSRSPRILVLDEPTSALTESETENLFRILKELRGKGIASILISHKLNEVFANSNRIVVLRDGKSVATYTTAGASRSDVIVAMVGRKLSELYPKSRAAPGAVVLDVRDLVVEHPMNAAKNIIDGVSFSVRAGEIVGLAGLVGAGRSELVNAVFGKNPARRGDVSIYGTRIERRNPADSIRHGMALVTENRKADGFIGVLSIRHNIALASLRSISHMGKIVRLKEQRSVKAFFDRLAIKATSMDAKVETLSGGNQQKVVISKWLMTNPRLLILDEPTRGIDVASKFEIYTIMNELAQNNMAIIMISSELEELVSMSDRILVLADGKIQAEMDAKDCTIEEILHIGSLAHCPDRESKLDPSVKTGE
jgi:D-xylose transport system ATP-binding protein